jgi:hypothetical protein
VFSTQLGDFAAGLFGSTALVERYAAGFPESLNGAPLFLPTRQNALRGRIDRWMEVVGIRPRIIGEFQDSALLTTFGRAGLGFFPAPLALAAQVASQLDAVPLGEMAGVSEQIYAISNERRIRHPAIEVLCAAAAPGFPGTTALPGGGPPAGQPRRTGYNLDFPTHQDSRNSMFAVPQTHPRSLASFLVLHRPGTRPATSRPALACRQAPGCCSKWAPARC